LEDCDGDEGDGGGAGGEEGKVEDEVCDAESNIPSSLLATSPQESI
jgi:hypothetical protein